jgi:hypothetical protein
MVGVSMKKKFYTRRDFLKESSAAVAAGTLYLNMPRKLLAQELKKEKVVLIRAKDLLDDSKKVRADNIAAMLDKAVMTLYGTSEPLTAWQQIIKPQDIVGIKSNVWGYLPTPPELEKAIKHRVMEVGVAEKNISIKDRGLLSDKVFLNATALINTRPMRTHHWSGVGTLLKNYIMFVKNPSAYHGDTCADLATIWKLPLVKDKTRLNILVMITPLFHSVGPHDFNSQYTWVYNGLIVGEDPVAVDATGVRILIAKRKEYFKEDRPLNPPPKHIFLADTRHHLGTADPTKIELIKLGWQENILI